MLTDSEDMCLGNDETSHTTQFQVIELNITTLVINSSPFTRRKFYLMN